MGFKYERGRCCLCQMPGADISVIISADPTKDEYFRDFNEASHETCFVDFNKTNVMPSTAIPRLLRLEHS